MFNRFNSSITAVCVSSLLLVGGCGDTQTASTSTTSTSRDADRAPSAESSTETKPSIEASLQEGPVVPRQSGSDEAARQRDLVESLTSPTAPLDAQAGSFQVVAEPMVLNLGEMATGETKRGVVKLRNTGETPMTVRDSRTSCGCTVANVPKGQELQPGESVDVEVSLRGGTRAEHLSKTVTFMVDGQPPMTVRVEGQTVAYVVIEPALLQLDDLSNEIVIRAEDGEPFRITAMHPRIAEDISNDASTEHRVMLSRDRWEEGGQPRRLLFYLDHPKASQVTAAIRVPANQLAAPSRTNDPTMQTRNSVPTRLTPEAMIAQNRTDEFLAQMQEEGFDANATDRAGVSLIGLAAKHGNVAMIQALIDAGADIEAAEAKGGRTPLMHAAQSKNVEAVRALLQAGANVDVRDTALANTALSWASGFGDAATVRELIDAGAQIEIVSNATGFTPLILASGFGESDSIRHLIEAGANVETTDLLQGFTAIMYAASTGKVQNIKALIEGNANVEAKDPAGRTVLLVAAGSAGADAATLQALIEAGADVSAVDRTGKNALEHARARTDPRRDEVVAVLESVMAASE